MWEMIDAKVMMGRGILGVRESWVSGEMGGLGRIVALGVDLRKKTWKTAGRKLLTENQGLGYFAACPPPERGFAVISGSSSCSAPLGSSLGKMSGIPPPVRVRFSSPLFCVGLPTSHDFHANNQSTRPQATQTEKEPEQVSCA